MTARSNTLQYPYKTRSFQRSYASTWLKFSDFSVRPAANYFDVAWCSGFTAFSVRLVPIVRVVTKFSLG